jgi:hypothetical protein
MCQKLHRIAAKMAYRTDRDDGREAVYRRHFRTARIWAALGLEAALDDCV